MVVAIAYSPFARICMIVAAVGALAAAIFISAGDWRLPHVWAYLAIYALIFGFGIMRMDDGLLRERLRPGVGADRALIVSGQALFAAHVIFAGLDIGRLHWSDTVPAAAQIGGLIVFGVACALVVWPMLVNPFFSPVVRHQAERGHRVIDSGPYAVVRHPGYAGVALVCLSSGVALGSWLACVPTIAFVPLVIRRLRLEERFLLATLPGYADYAGRVRYRLVPGIW